MSIGSFPPLNSVREIKEFDGSSENLLDFITSVEGHIAAYNFPVAQGGYVSGNMDDGWEYISHAKATAAENPPSCRLNYRFGYRFCLLLGERFTGMARDWWINHFNADFPKPNCWKKGHDDYCPPDVIQVSFRDMIMNQFSNPMDREVALMELETLYWNPLSESINSLRTRTATLFYRADVSDWKMQCFYLLRVLDDNMRRVIRDGYILN